MHHSLNQFMDKLLLSRSMMVTMSLLHSWVNFVESPGLLPLRPQGTSSMFASGQITVRTVKASVPSSQKVSAVFVLWICHGLFHCLTSLITHWFPACGSTIAADDVGGRLHLLAIHTLTHPIRTVAGSYRHRSHVSPLVILGIHNLKVKTKAFCTLNYLPYSLISTILYFFQSIMWLCPSLTLRLRWWIVTALMIVWRSWMETITKPHLLVKIKSLPWGTVKVILWL